MPTREWTEPDRIIGSNGTEQAVGLTSTRIVGKSTQAAEKSPAHVSQVLAAQRLTRICPTIGCPVYSGSEANCMIWCRLHQHHVSRSTDTTAKG
jgi:hypothetical protein